MSEDLKARVAAFAGVSMCIVMTPQADGTVTATYHGPFGPAQVEVLRRIVGAPLLSHIMTTNDVAAHMAVPREGVIV